MWLLVAVICSVNLVLTGEKEASVRLMKLKRLLDRKMKMVL